MTSEQKEFITQIGGYVLKYWKQYGIEIASPVIAQAILESGWGKSYLAMKYHNYFGLKCGMNWTGHAVHLSTEEESEPGVRYKAMDDFRVYDSMEEGVKGYFDFINTDRYRNLKGVTDAYTYLSRIIADGYATGSGYVDVCMELIRQFKLGIYDRTPQDIALEVIDGKWGVGYERSQKLIEAGYSPTEIQRIVNQILDK